MFIFAHTEICGCASFVLLNKGYKIWCVSTSSTGNRFFHFCHFIEGFLEILQRNARERETSFYSLTLNVPAIWFTFHIFSLTPF